ncbi:hypothetical protein MATR_04180 [Marivirga tractuosa]|uniref:DUF304 domain-containing protein n=1 Tax=Marivirga tractuosa (strain ATCC 23168 / DSM 4126 / NBRC 15989 / NCIMB 1408 / VKM B-1430 / H-43) TaxID=643867 RepID=E4TTB8_MARTH|nr:hypothetical protein [Marivirga tractuosa]ADR21948.1 hypothetical protein Ftrac_1963 [Marivirga tractuosa DSM 4126]BDD13593.1 hypothetical protein MATR_04180 [Marivirga tractuosa]
MVGEYYIDQNKVRDYYKKGLISFSLIHVYASLFLISVFFIQIRSFTLIGAGIVIAVSLVRIGVWMARTGEKTYEKTQIIIENNRIIRKGEGLITVRIPFSQIGRIKSHRNAIVVVRKGVLPVIQYYFDRFCFISNQDILYIPSMLENFNEIKKHLKYQK